MSLNELGHKVFTVVVANVSPCPEIVDLADLIIGGSCTYLYKVNGEWVRVIVIPVDRYKAKEASIMGLFCSENFYLATTTALDTSGLLAKWVLVYSD